jgi:uncharacterized protein YndB with AHSA1/START domain
MATVRITTQSATEILIVAEFRAARAAVWRAWTTPELVKQWWSGGFGEVTQADVDLRDGGAWRYVVRTDDGSELGFHGVYAEVVPEERLVWSEAYEGAPEEESTVNTATFTDTPGGTGLALVVRSRDRKNRDAILASGFEPGLHEGYHLLEQLANES